MPPFAAGELQRENFPVIIAAVAGNGVIPMKILAWVVGALMVVAVVVFGLEVVASESGDVVVLHTRDAGGEDQATRLWVVDHDGVPWLRSGGGTSSGWYGRLVAEPHVELERNGARQSYLAAPEPDQAGMINDLMRTKYGWRDQVVAVLAGSRRHAVAVRLTPLDGAGRPSAASPQ